MNNSVVCSTLIWCSDTSISFQNISSPPKKTLHPLSSRSLFLPPSGPDKHLHLFYGVQESHFDRGWIDRLLRTRKRGLGTLGYRHCSGHQEVTWRDENIDSLMSSFKQGFEISERHETWPLGNAVVPALQEPDFRHLIVTFLECLVS